MHSQFFFYLVILPKYEDKVRAIFVEHMKIWIKFFDSIKSNYKTNNKCILANNFTINIYCILSYQEIWMMVMRRSMMNTPNTYIYDKIIKIKILIIFGRNSKYLKNYENNSSWSLTWIKINCYKTFKLVETRADNVLWNKG